MMTIRILLAIAILSLSGLPALADDDPNKPELIEVITVLPPGDLAGEWRLGHRIAVIDEFTDLRAVNGAFEVGACVAIDGTWMDAGILVAEKVETIPAPCTVTEFRGPEGELRSLDEDGACAPEAIAAGTCVPGVRGSGSFFGFVEELPLNASFGEWLISNMVVEVGQSTEVAEEHSPLVRGACVEVRGQKQGLKTIATAIATASPHRCGDATELRQDWVEAAAPGATAAAKIGNRFTSHGQFVPPEEWWKGIRDQVRFEARISTRPEGRVGLWSVGGTPVEVDATTFFDGNTNQYIVGFCTDISGSRGSQSDIVLAKTFRPGHNCGDAPLPDDGVSTSFRGKVDTVPRSGMIGPWGIGGRKVATTGHTRFVVERGRIQVGSCVQINGVLRRDGVVVARTIQMGSNIECADDSPNPQPDGESITWRGIVEKKPVTGVYGDWNIRGRTVYVTSSSLFTTGNGPFRLGACVEVNGYTFRDDTIEATAMATFPENSCLRRLMPPRATPDTAPPGNYVDFLGFAETVPFGFVGNWRIGGRDVLSTAATEIDDTRGIVVVGACLEVEAIRGPDAVIRAHEIEVEPREKCPVGGGSPGVLTEFDARIQRLPAGVLTGDWIVGGRVVGVSATTRLDRDHGDFAVGACVEVKGYAKSSGRVDALVVETEAEADCAPGGAGGGDFRGIVESFPSFGFIGAWAISGRPVQVTADTNLKDTPGQPFRIGSCVEVSGSVDLLGRIVATEIETEPKFFCGGGDSDVELIGRIERAPPGLSVGIWQVEGQKVQALESTEGWPNYGPFVVGACVEVEGTRGVDRVLSATKARTLPPHECGPGSEIEGGFIGIIWRRPVGFDGEWLIGGVPVLVTATSGIDESQGLLRVGACAEVDGWPYPGGIYAAQRLATVSQGLCTATTVPGPPKIDLVINSANQQRGAAAPNSMIDIEGSNLAAETATVSSPRTHLGGTSVTLTDSAGDSFELGLFFASKTSLQAVIDPSASFGKATLEVRNSGGSRTATIEIAARAPALFSANEDGEGPASAMYWRIDRFGAVTNTLTYTDSPVGTRRSVVIPFGEGDQLVLTLYGTGFGTGSRGGCSVGGTPVSVRFIGETQSPGLSQVNLGPVPDSVRGMEDASVNCEFDGIETNTVTLSLGS